MSTPADQIIEFLKANGPRFRVECERATGLDGRATFKLLRQLRREGRAMTVGTGQIKKWAWTGK